MIEASVTLKPEAVELIQLLKELVHTPKDEGDWKRVAEKFPIVAEYAQNDRADFIPFGANVAKPEWSLNGTDWEFSCSTADHDDELKAFLEMLPKIATAATVDTEIEGFTGPILVDYELQGGVMVEVNRRRKYDDEDNWGSGFGYGR